MQILHFSRQAFPLLDDSQEHLLREFPFFLASSFSVLELANSALSSCTVGENSSGVVESSLEHTPIVAYVKH